MKKTQKQDAAEAAEVLRLCDLLLAHAREVARRPTQSSQAALTQVRARFDAALARVVEGE